eukprot:TRINITY_DN5862_c0_g1_i3.p1 TRINITY_DN5862_c0_g1~~TRINITY_DN5862_c0_g1_i3.p1  ORF type:complete len:588 (-),score=98.54 TRINITY_DN5862_c0_g1_i3:315-2078(-)
MPCSYSENSLRLTKFKESNLGAIVVSNVVATLSVCAVRSTLQDVVLPAIYSNNLPLLPHAVQELSQLFYSMKDLGSLSPVRDYLINAMKNPKNPARATRIHASLAVILNFYARARDEPQFLRLWKVMNECAKQTEGMNMYNSLMLFYSRLGRTREALFVYEQVKNHINQGEGGTAAKGKESKKEKQKEEDVTPESAKLPRDMAFNSQTYEIMIRDAISRESSSGVDGYILDMLHYSIPITFTIAKDIIQFFHRQRDAIQGMLFIEQTLPLLLHQRNHALSPSDRIALSVYILHFYVKVRKLKIPSSVWWKIIKLIDHSDLTEKEKTQFRNSIVSKITLSWRGTHNRVTDKGEELFKNISKLIKNHNFPVSESLFHSVLLHWAREGNLELFSATLAQMHAKNMNITSPVIYTLQVQLYASLRQWDKIKYVIVPALKFHNITLSSQTWQDLLYVCFQKNGDEMQLNTTAAQLVLHNMEEDSVNAVSTRNALIMLCARANDLAGVQSILQTLPDLLHVRLKTLRYLLFFFDFMYQNDAAAKFATSLIAQREKLLQADMESRKSRLLEIAQQKKARLARKGFPPRIPVTGE